MRIDSDKLISSLANAPIGSYMSITKEQEKLVFSKLIQLIRQQEHTGRWIRETYGYYDDDIYKCSECEQQILLNEGNPKENGYTYCPFCGEQLEYEQQNDEESGEEANGQVE